MTQSHIFSGLMCSLAISLASTTALAADADDRSPLVTADREARKQFQAGVNLLDDPDGARYEDAYRAFRKAHELTNSPKILGNLGYCAMHLERDGEAIDAYSTYLHDVPDIEERERVQIKKDLDTLVSTAARLRIRLRGAPANTNGFVLLDTRIPTRGDPIQNSYLIDVRQGAKPQNLRVRPGRHILRARVGDVDSTPLEVTIEPNTTVSPEIVFPSPTRESETPVNVETPKPAGSKNLVGPILLGSAGLLALGGGITAGVIARSKTNQIEDRCPNDVCPANYNLADNRDSAQNFATMADVAFVTGGVLLGGAVIFYALTPHTTEKSGAVKTRPRAGALCGPTGCSVALGGAF